MNRRASHPPTRTLPSLGMWQGAGVLELVDLVIAYVPAPGEDVVGAGESFPTLRQGEDLLWRDESGRLIGSA